MYTHTQKWGCLEWFHAPVKWKIGWNEKHYFGYETSWLTSKSDHIMLVCVITGTSPCGKGGREKGPFIYMFVCCVREQCLTRHLVSCFSLANYLYSVFYLLLHDFFICPARKKKTRITKCNSLPCTPLLPSPHPVLVAMACEEVSREISAAVRVVAVWKTPAISSYRWPLLSLVSHRNMLVHQIGSAQSAPHLYINASTRLGFALPQPQICQ